MQTKGNNDPLKDVTAENYSVPEGEEKLYHIKMDTPQFDPSTGVKISRARIGKFGIKTYKSLASTLKKQGYVMEILHDPFAETAKEPKKNSRKKAEKATEVEAPEPTEE